MLVANSNVRDGNLSGIETMDRIGGQANSLESYFGANCDAPKLNRRIAGIRRLDEEAIPGFWIKTFDRQIFCFISETSLICCKPAKQSPQGRSRNCNALITAILGFSRDGSACQCVLPVCSTKLHQNAASSMSLTDAENRQDRAACRSNEDHDQVHWKPNFLIKLKRFAQCN